MRHERDIHAVKIAAVQELGLAAEIFDLALLTELGAIADLQQLLRRNRHEPNAAAKPVKHPRLLKRRRNAEQRRALRIVAARMHRAGHRIALGMRRTDNRIQLAEHHNLRPRPSGINHRIKSGNPLRHRQLIPQLPELLRHISTGLDLLEPCLRMLPDPPLRVENHLCVFFYCYCDVFHVFASLDVASALLLV